MKPILLLLAVSVPDVDMASKEWKEMLAKSKFATWDRFGKEPKGHICLQDHGDKVAVRSIRIKTL